MKKIETMSPINRMPRKDEKIMFNSNGMFPDCDEREYIVLGQYNNHRDILAIENTETGIHTQVIVHFTSGYNEYLYFI